MSDCEVSSLLSFTKLSIRFEEIECKTLNETLIQQRMAHLADAECWKTLSRLNEIMGSSVPVEHLDMINAIKILLFIK